MEEMEKTEVLTEEVEDIKTEEIKTEEVKTEEKVDDGKVPREELIKERKKRQETERRLREYEERSIETDILKEKEEIKQQYIEDGFSVESAEKIASREARRSAEIRQLKMSLTSTPVDSEIKELAESEEFFSDAPVYKDKIVEKMKSQKCDAETAYMLVRGSARRREMQTDIEQRLIHKKNETEEKKVDSSTSSKPTNLYKLDEDDKKALKNLQLHDPKGAWTEEKYTKIKQR
jgi:hypothetical protein